jgi:hypothetical protein
MQVWQSNLEYVAAGALAAGLVELAAGRGHTRAQTLGRVLAGGALAAAYANFVPRASWGVRSGAAFAQSPMVRALDSALGAAAGLEMAAAGGLAGMVLRLAA